MVNRHINWANRNQRERGENREWCYHSFTTDQKTTDWMNANNWSEIGVYLPNVTFIVKFMATIKFCCFSKDKDKENGTP